MKALIRKESEKPERLTVPETKMMSISDPDWICDSIKCWWAERYNSGRRDMEDYHDEKVGEVLHFIRKHGDIQGDHHKTWMLEEIMKILKGPNFLDCFIDWYERFEDKKWKRGIAP